MSQARATVRRVDRNKRKAFEKVIKKFNPKCTRCLQPFASYTEVAKCDLCQEFVCVGTCAEAHDCRSKLIENMLKR